MFINQTDKNKSVFGRRFLAILLSFMLIAGNAPVIGSFAYADDITDAGSVTEAETHIHDENCDHEADGTEPVSTLSLEGEPTPAAETDPLLAEGEVDAAEAYVALVIDAEDNTKYFATLDAALAYANAAESEMTVVLADDATIADASVGANVALLLPYQEGGADVLNKVKGNGTGATPAWNNEAKFLNHTLTVTGTLNVDGDLQVGGVTGVSVQHAPQGMTTGSYSRIIINDGAEINVSGNVAVYGQIKGSGQLNMAAGSTLEQPLLINDFPGGSIVMETYKNFLPFQRYGLNNVQCTTELVYGAKLYGTTRVYAADIQNDAGGTYIISDGSGDALFNLQPGASVKIEYSADNKIESAVGKTKLTFTGGASVGNISVDLGIFGKMDTSYTDVPVPYNMEIVVLDGDYSITENVSVKLLPGVSVTIGEGAVFNVSDGGRFLVYDGLYSRSYTSAASQAYPSSTALQNGGFSASADLTLEDGGVLNIERGGTFAGIVQNSDAGTGGTPSVINTAQGAVLGVEGQEDGVEFGTRSYISTKNIAARYWNGTEWAEMEDCTTAAHTYTAYTGAADLEAAYLEGYEYTYRTTPDGENTADSYNYGTTEPKSGHWNICDVTYVSGGEGYTVEVAAEDAELFEKGVVRTGSDLTVTVKVAEGYSVSSGDAPVVKSSGVTAALDSKASDAANGIYVYKIADITANQSITVSGIKDTTAPTGTVEIKGTNYKWINEFIETIAEWLHFNVKQDVIITADDSGSGVAEAAYMISKKGIYKDILELTHSEQPWTALTLNGDNTWEFNFEDIAGLEDEDNIVVYVYIKDASGNSTYISSDGMVYDVKAPAITINDVPVESKVYNNTRDAALKVKITEKNLDFVRVDTVAADGTRTAGAVLKETGGTVEITATDNKDTAYIVYAADKAGNYYETPAFYYINRHTVAFHDADGSTILEARAFDYEHQLTERQIPKDPVKEAADVEYTFAGWKSSDDGKVYRSSELPAVTESVIYTAVYEITGYKVTLPESSDDYTVSGDAYAHANDDGVFAYTFTVSDIDTADVCGLNVSVTDADGDAVTADAERSEDLKSVTYTVTVDAAVTVTVEAYGHNDESITKETNDPTCTEDGSIVTTCGDCGWTKTEPIAATGHDYENIDQPPTCTEEGKASGKCKNCTHVAYDETIPALGHSFTKYIFNEGTAACEKNGTKTATCDRCDVKDTVEAEHTALGHAYSTEVERKVPTCETDGYEVRSCTRCEYTETSYPAELKAINHKNVEITTVEPGCETQGFTISFCPDCGESKVYDYVNENNHSRDSIGTAKPATCTEDGITAGEKCTVCDKVLEAQEVLPATGHTEVTVPAIAATCVTDGRTAGKTCSVCKETLLESETVPATGHTYGEWEVTSEGSCTKDEQRERICTVCTADTEGHTQTETITAPEHKYGEWIETKAATCAAEGEETHWCAACEHYETQAIAKEDHNYVTSVTEPTCQADGFTVSFCQGCGDSIVTINEDSKLAHEIETIKGYPATCTEDGLTDGAKCTVCGTVTVNQEVIKAGGHNYVASVTAPTCTEKGYTTYTCTNFDGDCRHSYVADWIDAAGHTEVLDEAVAPGCTSAGLTEGSHCSVCGDVIIAQEAVDATGHTEAVMPAKAAKCGEPGLTEGIKCSDCGEVLKAQEETPALEHEYTEAFTAATCTTDAFTLYYCAECGHSEIAVAEGTATGHTFKDYVSDNNAACTADGTKTAKCEDCDAEETITDEGTATGHSFKNYVSNDDATCAADGTKTAECDNRGCSETDTVTEEGSALGHKYGAWVETTAPGCETEGEEARECARCGHDETQIVKALGHDLMRYDGEAATCTEDGYAAYEACGRCEYHTFTEIPAAGHTEVIDEAVAATCTSTGLTEGKHCSVCGEVLASQETTAKLGHTMEVIKGTDATCTESGLSDGAKCSGCGELMLPQIYLPAAGHTEEIDAAVAATCTEAGLTQGRHCSDCGEILKAQEETPATGHTEEILAAKDADCASTGLTEGTKCSECGEILKAQEEIPALGHSMKYVYSQADKKHAEECQECGYSEAAESCEFDSGVITKEPTASADGVKTYTCSICDGTYTEAVKYEAPAAEVDKNVYRIYGKHRYATSLSAAKVLKEDMGVSKFDNIIIASGATFADALPGSYLAAEKDAPILLIDKSNAATLKSYVKNNLKSGGTVYVLGGTGVIPDSWVKGMPNVERLGGKDRYATNLLILKEAGIDSGSDILVCTGTGFADSLSASATGKPILLVGDKLNSAQKKYLNGLSGKEAYYMIGGTGAVNDKVMKECDAYGSVGRVYGKDRFATSVAVAKKFFGTPDYAVLAYGYDFPDGLSAGPLAYNLDAPLILTATGSEGQAKAYAKSKGIKYGYVLGGPALISDKAVKSIFQMSNSAKILVK